jgi:hypothetical protein
MDDERRREKETIFNRRTLAYKRLSQNLPHEIMKKHFGFINERGHSIKSAQVSPRPDPIGKCYIGGGRHLSS